MLPLPPSKGSHFLHHSPQRHIAGRCDVHPISRSTLDDHSDPLPVRGYIKANGSSPCREGKIIGRQEAVLLEIVDEPLHGIYLRLDATPYRGADKPTAGIFQWDDRNLPQSVDSYQRKPGHRHRLRPLPWSKGDTPQPILLEDQGIITCGRNPQPSDLP